jgi:hypothetical protein
MFGKEVGVNASTVRGWEQLLNTPTSLTKSFVEAYIEEVLKKQYRSK